MARPTLYVARTADIGPALRDLRRAEDISQADAAAAILIHPSHMGTYERGTVIPNSRRLLEILLSHHYVIGYIPKELASGLA